MKLDDLLVSAFIQHPEAPPELAKVREAYRTLKRQWPQDGAVDFVRNEATGKLYIVCDPIKIVLNEQETTASIPPQP